MLVRFVLFSLLFSYYMLIPVLRLQVMNCGSVSLLQQTKERLSFPPFPVVNNVRTTRRATFAIFGCHLPCQLRPPHALMFRSTRKNARFLLIVELRRPSEKSKGAVASFVRCAQQQSAAVIMT